MQESKFVFKCDTPCKKANSEECRQLECLYGQMSVVNQLMDLKRENDLFKISSSAKYDVLNKYYKTLVEIRNITETHKCISCDIYDADCNNCHDIITNNGETCMKKGLDKISELAEEILNLNLNDLKKEAKEDFKVLNYGQDFVAIATKDGVEILEDFKIAGAENG